ncbi:MAG: phosphotransferase [Anaerolineaceae bacterium]|nr:phosphotransferase [Anaerolineaceae bacterium]
MAKYTSLEAHEIDALAQRYGLEVSDFSSIEAGDGNSSYYLSATEGEFVLTVSDNRPLDDVKNVAGLLNHLAEYDFPASRVVPLLDGDKVTLYRDMPVILKNYIPGEIMRDIPEKGLYTLGLTLARLHQISAPDFIPQTHSFGVDTFSDAIGLGFDVEFEDWLAEKGEWVEGMNPIGLPRSLIHCDVSWDNIICLDGEFQALIDFEDACEFFKAYDLSSAFYGICIQDGILDLEQASQILSGYQEIRPLDEDESAMLQPFGSYVAVALSAWRYTKYNLHNPTEERKHTHRETMVLAEMIQAIPPEEFNLVFS